MPHDISKSGTAAETQRFRAGSSRQTSRETIRQIIHSFANSIEVNWKGTRRARDIRRDMIAMYAGSHYSDDAELMPINVFHRAQKAIAVNIVANAPTVKIKRKTILGRPFFAKGLSHHMTERLNELRFKDMEQLAFMDAQTMFGMVKIGLAPKNPEDMLAEDEHLGDLADPGQLYINRISPDDTILDMSARVFPETRFVGHRMRLSIDRLHNLGLGDEEIRLLPTWAKRGAGMNPSGVESIGHKNFTREEASEFTEWFDVIELHVRAGVLGREALTILLPGDPSCIGTFARKTSSNQMFVKDPVEYEGPEGGPYEMLSFDEIPDNVLPTPPAGFTITLAKMVNALGSHIIDSDTKMKKVTLYGDEIGDDEIDAIERAKGPWAKVRVTDPSAISTIEQGGSSPKALESLGLFLGLFSQEAGNSDQLSGVGSGGKKTATEVQDIRGRLGVILQDFEDKFHTHSDRVLAKAAWWVMTDPLFDEKVVMRSRKIPIPLRLTRDQMGDSDHFDYNYSVQRGTMRRLSPEQKSQQLMNVGANIVPVAIQLEQMTGGAFKATPFIMAVTEGIIDPAEILEWWNDSEMQAQNAMMGLMFPGSGLGTAKLGGVPGTAGAPGQAFTGSASANFNPSQIAGQTLQGMGLGSTAA